MSGSEKTSSSVSESEASSGSGSGSGSGCASCTSTNWSFLPSTVMITQSDPGFDDITYGPFYKFFDSQGCPYYDTGGPEHPLYYRPEGVCFWSWSNTGDVQTPFTQPGIDPLGFYTQAGTDSAATVH